LIQLLFGGRDSSAIPKALQNLLELGNLLLPPESISGKQDGKREQSRRDRPQPVRKVFQLLPRQVCHRRRKQYEQQQSPSPQLALLAFQPAWRRIGLAGSWIVVAHGGLLWRENRLQQRVLSFHQIALSVAPKTAVQLRTFGKVPSRLRGDAHHISPILPRV